MEHQSLIIAFSKVLSKELSSYGIKVNVIAPSLTDTDMAHSKEAKEREFLSIDKKFTRMAKPEEVADLVAFLCSNESEFVNGQVIRIDGGNQF